MNRVPYLLLGFILLVGKVSAQETINLSLPDAIALAQKNRAAAIKADLDIQKGDAQIAEVRANALPKLNVVSSTTYNPLLQENVLPGEIFGAPGRTIKVAFGQKWSSANMLQLTQVLFNQSVFTGLKAAKSTKEFYILNRELTQTDLIEKVAQAYFQVYKSQQMLQNLDVNLELTNKTVKIIKGLYDAGLATKIDYDRTRVAVNNANASRQQVANAVELSKNALKFMVGLAMETDIVLPQNSFDPLVLLDNETSPSYNDRIELKVLNKQIELLNWKMKASISEYYPSAALSASYGWLGQGKKMPWFYGKNDGVFWGDMSSIALNINIPIFNGFATKSRIAQNKIDIEKANADLQETKNSMNLALKNSQTLLNNSLITISNQEANVTLAQSVLTNTQNNYRYGLATLNDLLEAERSLSEARNNLTNARLDYKMGEIDYLKSQGKLNTLSNSTQPSL